MGPMNAKSSQSSEAIQQLQGKRVQQHSHIYQSTINKTHTSKGVIRWYTVPTVILISFRQMFLYFDATDSSHTITNSVTEGMAFVLLIEHQNLAHTIN